MDISILVTLRLSVSNEYDHLISVRYAFSIVLVRSHTRGLPILGDFTFAARSELLAGSLRVQMFGWSEACGEC